MKYGKLLLLVITGLLIYQCQTATPSVTDIEPENAVISGVIFQPDGATPAAGARVMIRPVDFLVVPEEAVLGKKSSVKDTVQTDDKGVFSFDTSIEAGTYLIEAMSENDIVLIDSIEVNEKIKTITTQPAILKPAGAIKGSVVLPGGGNYQDVFVLAFGIDRFTRVREDGGFCFSNLGEGTYSIRVVSSDKNYGIFDTAGIGVVSADTTDIGAVALVSDMIPVPQNLSFTYDTLLLRVTLRWNRCNYPGVKEYAIYRRFADSTMVFEEPIARRPGSDTVMIDSTVIHDFRYEYRVAVVGMNDEEGAKSDGVIVTTASYFTVDTVFNLYEGEFNGIKSLVDIAVSANGDLYFTDAVNNCVQVFDKDMNFKRRMGEEYLVTPLKIKLDENGLAIVMCKVFDSVYEYPGGSIPLKGYIAFYIFDAVGVIVDSIADSIVQMHGVRDFDVRDSLIYMIENDGNSIGIYTYKGIQLRNWSPDSNLRAITKGSDGKIYVGHGEEVIVFDTLGNTLSRIPVPGCGGRYNAIYNIEYDTVGNRCISFLVKRLNLMADLQEPYCGCLITITTL